MLDKLPIFPKITTQDNPRPWLNEEQYSALLGAIRKAIRDKVVVRYVPITEELLDLTNFMVNSFLRSSDIKILKNKDINIIKRPGKSSYLRIMARSKVKAAQVVTTSAAVTIYERIQGDPEAYVFFPQYQRDHAMQVMAKQFKYVLEQAGLKKGENGQESKGVGVAHGW
jgi:hypothetical protein